MPLNLLAMLFLMQPGMRLASFAAMAHCWLMSSLLSTRIPRSFSANLLSIQSAPTLVNVTVLPQMQDLALPFVELHDTPHFSSLLRYT